MSDNEHYRRGDPEQGICLLMLLFLLAILIIVAIVIAWNRLPNF